MGTASMGTVTDEQFTAAGYDVLTGARQNMRAIPTPLADDALSRGKKSVQGGHTIQIPYEFEEHSTPTQLTFASPYHQFTTTNAPTMKSGTDTWGAVVQPVFMSGLDKNIYRGPAAQLDVWRSRVQNVDDHGHRSLEQALLLGTTASGSYTPSTAVGQFAGFNTFNGTDYATGLIEEDASGGNTIHGISRSSYSATTYPKFHPVVANMASAVNTNGFDRLIDLQTTFMKRGGNMAGVDIYASDVFVRMINKILRAPFQYATLAAGSENYGIPNLFGKKLKIMNAMPQTGANSATSKWSALGLTWGTNDTAGCQFRVQQGWEWTMSPVVSIPGTADCQLALFRLHGQLLLITPGNNFLIYNGETF